MTGTAVDPISGVATVTCNEVQATLALDEFSREVPVVTDTGPLTVTVDADSVASADSLEITASSRFTLTAAPGAASLIVGRTVGYAVSIASEDGFSTFSTVYRNHRIPCSRVS